MSDFSASGSLGDRIVETGSRLHFGLFALGNPAWEKNKIHPGSSLSGRPVLKNSESTDERNRFFGGIGVMVDWPKLQVRFNASDQLMIQNDSHGYLRSFVASWCRFCHQNGLKAEVDQKSIDFSEPNKLPIRLNLLQCGPRHSGLGVGTQLGLSVGRGLFESFFWK